MDAEIADISARATLADVVAARQYLRVREAHGSVAARICPGAMHLARTYDIVRRLGAVARRIAADHSPELTPHEAAHQRSRARLLATWRAGGMTDEQLVVRLDRVRALRDEREQAWAHVQARDARARYRALSPEGKVRARLLARSRRPRAAVGVR